MTRTGIARGGRPRSQPELRRTELLGLRVTPSEYLLVRALAARRGSSISALLRDVILDGPRALARELERSA